MHWFESKNTKTCLRKHENKAFLKYYELKSSQNFPPPAESGREMFFFGDFSNMGENLSLWNPRSQIFKIYIARSLGIYPTKNTNASVLNFSFVPLGPRLRRAILVSSSRPRRFCPFDPRLRRSVPSTRAFGASAPSIRAFGAQILLCPFVPLNIR